MRRILVALALVLVLVCLSAESCDMTGNGNQPTYHCLYRIDYTSQTRQEDVSGTPPDQLTLGATTTHLVHGSCHK